MNQKAKEVASKTSDTAGDGTTTATVLAQAIYNEGQKLVAAGLSPMALKRGIDKGVGTVVAELKKLSKPIKDKKEVEQVGTVSANSDETIGKLISEAMEKVGKEGVSGSPEYGILDNLAVLDLEREFELSSSSSMDITDQMAQPAVFERLLTIVLELAVEGKESRPLGTIFVMRDHEKVMNMSSQMVINPFSSVPETERNILDPVLKETLREFSTIDGAFIIRHI